MRSRWASTSPTPLSAAWTGPAPEQEAELADAVGMALLVVLGKLSPTERLAFVLHDMFAVPFDDIAPIVGRSPNTAAQLASRARRRVRGSAAATDTSLARQREAVGAWIAAARGGAHAAGLAASYRRSAPFAHAALVSESAGIVVTADGGQPASVMAFTFAAGKITEIYILADRSRLTRLGPAPPDNSTGRTQ
jgi:Sigma-70, region 4